MSDERDLLARALRSAEADAPPIGAKERALARLEGDRRDFARAQGALGSVPRARSRSARPIAIASMLAFAAGAVFVLIVRGRWLAQPRPEIAAVSDSDARGGVASPSNSAGASRAVPSEATSGAAPLPAPDASAPATPSASARALRHCAGLTRPESPPRSCAVPGDPLLLELVNDCDEPLELFWVNAECREVSYGTLLPGAHRFQGTVATHPWRLRSRQSGALVRDVEPTGTPTLAPTPRAITFTATDADPAPTDAPPTTCSEVGHTVDLTVTNGRSSAVELVFVDYDCKEVPKRQLAPGESWRKKESDGHRWRMRDVATKRLVRELQVEGAAAGRRLRIVVP